MEKLKDFFYDKNDLVVALIIIAIAALLIAWRVDIIMDYPQVMAAQLAQQQQGGLHSDDTDDTDGTDPNDANGAGQVPDENGDGQDQTPDVTPPPVNPPATNLPPATPPPAATNPPASTGTVSVTIPSGASGDKIAQILVDAGVVGTASDFTSAVAAAKADTKLKAGTFKIPAGSTVAQVVSIITK